MTRLGWLLTGLAAVVMGGWVTLALSTALASATANALVAANSLAATCVTGVLVVIGVVAGTALGYFGRAVQTVMGTPKARRRLFPRWFMDWTLPKRQTPVSTEPTCFEQLSAEVVDLVDLPLGEEWGW